MIYINENITRELVGIIKEAKSVMLDLTGDTIVSFKRMPRLITRIDNVLNLMDNKERKDNEKKETI